jgi:hypothetical protein
VSVYCWCPSTVGVRLLLVSVFSALLTFASPLTSHAIPIAGNYMFTSGLTGTFTSDGNQLTTWNFTDPLDSILPVTWDSSSPLKFVSSNTPTSFLQEESGRIVGGPGTFFLYQVSIDWTSNQFNANRFDDSFAPPIDEVFNGTYSFAPATGNPVPEPSTFGLLAIGLVTFVAYKRRQAGQLVG